MYSFTAPPWVVELAGRLWRRCSGSRWTVMQVFKISPGIDYLCVCVCDDACNTIHNVHIHIHIISGRSAGYVDLGPGVVERLVNSLGRHSHSCCIPVTAEGLHARLQDLQLRLTD